MSDSSRGKPRGSRRGNDADDRAESRILPPESRSNEKTDILPAIDFHPQPRHEEYSSRRHPVWVPAPTTVDHGPPHLPPSPMAFAAKMTIAMLIVLALGGVVLFLLKWW